MKFLAALQFLTIIPVPGKRKISPEELGRSAGYFPAVGLIIGLILAGLNWLFSLLLPASVVHVLLVAFLAIITGALHLDGLADTCDGIAGHKSAEDRWQVMRDSHSGGFSIVGIALVLLVKYISLNNIAEPLLLTSLVFMPVVSRWAMVYAIFAYPYARPSGLGKAFKDGTRWLKFTAATLMTLVIAVVLAKVAGLAVLFIIWLIVAALAAYLKSKLSGLTGDTYGAINEIAEASVLILVLALARLGLA